MSDKLTVQMTCKITHIEPYQGNFYHIVVTPAIDEYTRPSSYKVKSNIRLGEVNQKIDLTAELSGYVHKKNYIDPKTGVMKDIYNSHIFFDATTATQKPMAKAS